MEVALLIAVGLYALGWAWLLLGVLAAGTDPDDPDEYEYVCRECWAEPATEQDGLGASCAARLDLEMDNYGKGED